MDTLAPSLASPVDALTQHVPQAAPRTAAPAEALQQRQGILAGGLHLMVRYEDGSELTDLPSLHALPHAPDWLLGMANLHGVLIPVFDLGRFLGLDNAAPARPMLLVLGHGSDAAGLVIDGLPQRLRFGPTDSTGAGTAPPALAGAIRQGVLLAGQVRFDIDCAALLDAFEQALEAAA